MRDGASDYIIGICGPDNALRLGRPCCTTPQTQGTSGEKGSAMIDRVVGKMTVPPDDSRVLSARNAFGSQLAWERVQAGWTQGELGRRVGLDRHYVCKLENGHKAPTFAMTLRLADAMGISVAVLMQPADRAYRGGRTLAYSGSA